MLVYQRVYLNISQLNAILRTSCSSPVLRTHLEACTPGPSRTPALSTKWKSRQTASWSWWKNYKKKFIWIKWIRRFAYHSFNNYLVVINGDLIYQYPQKILIKWMYFKRSANNVTITGNIIGNIHFIHIINLFIGNFRDLNWRYLQYIRPIFQA